MASSLLFYFIFPGQANTPTLVLSLPVAIIFFMNWDVIAPYITIALLSSFSSTSLENTIYRSC